MLYYPTVVDSQIPKTSLQYARSYVLDQPYVCTVTPAQALKMGTIFPFLLATYAPSLKKADKGVDPWEI